MAGVTSIERMMIPNLPDLPGKTTDNSNDHNNIVIP